MKSLALSVLKWIIMFEEISILDEFRYIEPIIQKKRKKAEYVLVVDGKSIEPLASKNESLFSKCLKRHLLVRTV